MIRRRAFITLLGGAAAWPLGARAQQGDRARRIGVLLSYDENDPLGKTVVSAFTQALADLGWTFGRDVRMDLRGVTSMPLKNPACPQSVRRRAFQGNIHVDFRHRQIQATHSTSADALWSPTRAS